MNIGFGYVDDLITNGMLESDESDTIYHYIPQNKIKSFMLGGDINSNDVPNGGFPPIFECDKAEATNIKKDNEVVVKKRETTPIKSSVSITKILDKRREKTPFIKLKK